MAAHPMIKQRSILTKYIVDGRVDYIKLKSDQWLTDTLVIFRQVNVENLSTSEKFAFWLNAYNLLTLASVLKEMDKNPDWDGTVSYWSRVKFHYLRKHKIGGKNLSLYYIENKILRKVFKDPRIHFALNCASMSCPYLPNELFEATTLDHYLENLTADFINLQNSVKFKDGILYLNKIFKWYRKDFQKSGGVISFINKYWQGQDVPATASIKYLDYDWKFNIID